MTIKSDYDPHAVLARIEQVVDALTADHAEKNWTTDKQECDRVLAHFRALPSGAESLPDYVAQFLGRYNQSFDWVLMGDPKILICIAASQSRAAKGA